MFSSDLLFFNNALKMSEAIYYHLGRGGYSERTLGQFSGSHGEKKPRERNRGRRDAKREVRKLKVEVDLHGAESSSADAPFSQESERRTEKTATASSVVFVFLLSFFSLVSVS